MKVLKNIVILYAFGLATTVSEAQTASKLTGTVINDGSTLAKSSASNAFDGSTSTYFYSGTQSSSGGGGGRGPGGGGSSTATVTSSEHPWVGLDLGSTKRITRVRWYNYAGSYSMTINFAWDGKSTKTVKMPYSQVAVFEGANSADFSDALPIYLVNDASTTSAWHEAEVTTDRAFRYVRYVGPNSSCGYVYEVEFYGYDSEDTAGSRFYEPAGLPVVVAHTTSGSDPVDKTNELEASFAFISQEGTKIMEQTGNFRLRGNTSLVMGKKPYRIKLDAKQKVFGADYKAKKWTLVPAMDDKSLMRNIIGFEANRRIGQEYTPYCRAVDVFVNGEFRGQYQFCDQVEANKNRIDIEEIEVTEDESGNITDRPSSAYDFGWFIEIDKLASQEPTGTWFTSSNYSIPVTIKSPDEDEITSGYLSTIKSHFEKMETAAKNGTAEQYADLTSFGQYFLVSELIGNTDAYHSINLHKHQDRDQFYFGPVWDLNLAFDNDDRWYPINSMTIWSYQDADGFADAGNIISLLDKMLNSNTDVLPEMKDIWATQRQNGQMEQSAFDDMINSLEVSLKASADLNFIRWDILDTRIFSEPQNSSYYNFSSWEAAVAKLRSTVSGRVAWMDGMLGTTTTSQNVTLSAAGWATVFLPMAFGVPEGLECYEVTGVDAATSKLLLEPVENTQANKPYLLHGEAGTYTLTGYSSVGRDKRTLGLLTGTQSGCTVPLGSYVLQNHDGAVCFYEVQTGNIQLGGKKAYLTVPADAAGAAARFYLDDEAEGLRSLAHDEAVGGAVRIYDAMGHLLRVITEGQWSEQEIVDEFGSGMYIIRTGSQSRKAALGD